MDIPFIKMHGAGNDYIYLDLLDRSMNVDFSALSKAMSPRHFGVGADGLVLILRGEKEAFRMRMFNADGSEAEMCGNAIRCVGKYLYDSGHAGDRMRIETLAGVKTVQIASRDESGALLLRVDMGRPFLAPKDIPVTADREPVVDLSADGYTGTAVGMGNPHFVIFTDRITDEMVLKDGPKLEVNPLFPRKTNVEFIQQLSGDRLRMRVWERGSGETLACGTGACAAAVASAVTGRTGRSVQVELLGGTLRIDWDDSETVYLTGPAVEAFRGMYRF